MSSSIRCRYGSATFAWLIPIVYLPSVPLQDLDAPGDAPPEARSLVVPQPASTSAATAAAAREIRTERMTEPSLRRGAESLQRGGGNDHQALDQELDIGVDVVQGKDVVQNAEQQRTRYRPGDRTTAARQAGAADHHRGDRVQLVADTVVRATLVELDGVHDAGQ